MNEDEGIKNKGINDSKLRYHMMETEKKIKKKKKLVWPQGFHLFFVRRRVYMHEMKC